ncbi:MAG: hypothetical protein IKE91_05265 [Clostridia bacterium]|nr:hypothetical protein [Clostridia bacterium]
MKIYPKASAQVYGEEFKEELQKAEGVELQFFDENGIMNRFNFEDEVRKYKALYPQLKEIIVHPPLSNYNIEHIFFKDEEIFKEQLLKMKELTEELDIDMDFVYHTYWPVRQFVASGFADRIKNQIKLIEGARVTILIENLFMMLDEKDECAALEVCKLIDSPNVRCCIDTTHMHCKANIYRRDFLEMVNSELNKEDCEKYVKQIHFAATLNNDGFLSKKNHGRVHECIENVQEEYDWLKNLGMGDKNFITEVGEEDYYSRADQIKEINMLGEITT